MKLRAQSHALNASVFQNKDDWSLQTIVDSVHMWKEVLLQFKRDPPSRVNKAGLPLSLSQHHRGPFFFNVPSQLCPHMQRRH